MRSVRIVRAGLLIGWIVIAALVVAGFAAFSADDTTAPVPVAIAAPADVGDLGRITGAVAGLGFAATTPTIRTTETSMVLDPTADAFSSEPPSTTTTLDDRRNGVFVRSAYLSEPDVRTLVAEFFRPEDVNKAVRVAFCESSFNPAAVNPATGASGLFQHLPEHWAERSDAAGWTGSSIFDARANVAVAAWLLYDFPGGWTHWDCTP